MPHPTEWTMGERCDGWTVWLGLTGFSYDEWQERYGVGDTGIVAEVIWTRDIDGVPVSPDNPEAIRHEALQYGSAGAAGLSSLVRPSQWPKTDIATMNLDAIRAELWAISGTPYRSEDDLHRRQALWRRLDRLVAARDAAA